MASLPIMSFTPAKMRVYAASAAKGGKEEKGLFDWILGGLAKEDQFYETDPILQKVEDKTGSGGGGGGTTTSGSRSKNSVAVPQKKKGGGFGGLFAKKE